MRPAAILDVDGTLVDTDYHQVVAALAGDDVERERGDDIRAAETALYLALIEEVEPRASPRSPSSPAASPSRS